LEIWLDIIFNPIVHYDSRITIAHYESRITIATIALAVAEGGQGKYLDSGE
jgi:hypothetical protein